MDHFEPGDLVLITKKVDIGGVWVNLMDQTIGQIAKLSTKQLCYRSDLIYIDVYITQVKDIKTWLYPIESLKRIELKDKADNQAFQDLIQV